MYNIEREKGRILLKEGFFFSLQGCKESKNPFTSEWEVWKRFLQRVVSFSSVETCFQVFESIKFQGESVWKRVLGVVEDFNFEI